MDTEVRRQIGQERGTPNFIRNHCAEQFLEALPIVQAIIYGGLVMKRSVAAKLRKQGVPLNNDGLMYATIDQRLKAIELLGKIGIGVRTDHTTGDREILNGVIEMPPWAEEVEIEIVTDSPVRGALESGNGQPEPGPNGQPEDPAV